MKKLLLLAFVLLGAGQAWALTCNQCNTMNENAQRNGSNIMINCGSYCSSQNLSQCEMECMFANIEPCCCPGSVDPRCS